MSRFRPPNIRYKLLHELNRPFEQGEYEIVCIGTNYDYARNQIELLFGVLLDSRKDHERDRWKP